MATTYRIHPGIGIARVGDSDNRFFVGPEAPGVPAVLAQPGGSSKGTYKDAAGHIKRQGARFRVYEYTDDGAGVVTAVREITAAEAEIEWEVHLANRKAAAPRFLGSGHRNEQVPESQRSQLIIDAGPQRIAGANQSLSPLSGRFMTSMTVRLGDLLTDEGGRLIVLGGKGESQSLPGQELEHFADNDGWCDDMSDGPIRARVRLAGSAETIEADSAWVIVAPPDFAPPIENVITLYDVVYSMMATFEPALAVGDATPVSFTRDIYPILRRVSHMHWVSAVAAPIHGEGGPLHFVAPEMLEMLASSAADAVGSRRNGLSGAAQSPGWRRHNAQAAERSRSHHSRRIAHPGAVPPDGALVRGDVRGRLAGVGAGTDPTRHDSRGRASACPRPGRAGGVCWRRLLPWNRGQSSHDRSGHVRPQAAVRRVSAKLAAGTLTAGMAVPWQADFRDCTIEEGADWWPGQRPNQVRRGATQAEWVPETWTRHDMVDQWSKLGFVTAKKVGTKTEYHEDERAPDLLGDS